MSTTTDREVALMYMRQSDKAAKMVFEIRMGMIDRGADVSLLSQFPGEKEFLFAPLTGLEVASVPRVEGDVVVVELRLSCNLHDQTLEEVIGKMRTSHTALASRMMSKFVLITRYSFSSCCTLPNCVDVSSSTCPSSSVIMTVPVEVIVGRRG